MIDSHCHLDLACFANDIDAVLHRAQANGIQQCIIPGIDPAHWPIAEQLAQRFCGVHFTLGHHPFFYPKALQHEQIDGLMTKLRSQLMRVLGNKGCIGIGEIGIDRTLDTPIDIQIAMFDAQLKLAQEAHLPVIIHHRKSHDLIIGRIRHTGFTQGGVIHAFSGNAQIAQEYVDSGFCLGVGGTITYPRGHKTLTSIMHVGLAHCVLETDAPDMPMSGRQGQRNEPAYLTDVVQVLSQAFKQDSHSIATMTSHNVQRTFALLSKSATGFTVI